MSSANRFRRKKPFVRKAKDAVDITRKCKLCGREIVVVTPKKETDSDKPVALDRNVPSWWKDSTTGLWLPSRNNFIEHRFV